MNCSFLQTIISATFRSQPDDDNEGAEVTPPGDLKWHHGSSASHRDQLPKQTFFANEQKILKFALAVMYFRTAYVFAEDRCEKVGLAVCALLQRATRVPAQDRDGLIERMDLGESEADSEQSPAGTGHPRLPSGT